MMRVAWVLFITISGSIFTSCLVQPNLSEGDSEDEIKLPLVDEELGGERPNLFRQDRNKSYSQIDRPWVLAKPLLEYNKSNSFFLEDE